MHETLGRLAAGPRVLAALPEQPIDHATVVDIGRDSAGRATASTWIASRGMPFMSGATTLLMDADTHEPLALGSATQLGEGLLRAATDPAQAKPARPRMTALTLYHVQDTPDSPPRFGMAAKTMTTQDGPAVTVKNPQIQVADHTAVRIGLNRPPGSYNPDCDYVFSETAIQPTDPNLLVPFTGTASLPFPITGVQANGQISGLTVATQIYVALSTTALSYPVDPASLLAGITADLADPYVLSWSFPYSPRAPIVYSPTIGALDMKSAFFFQFSVPVNDPSSPYVFAICSTDTPGQPSVQCIQIPDVEFTWHCVAEGTQVTLADGAQVEIGQTAGGMRVRTGLGDATLGVEANWRAVYSGAEGHVLRLTTTGGHSLLLTAQHPVLTPAGLVAAADLRSGDTVLVAGGAHESLAAVERADDYAGVFWNLHLGTEEDRRAGLVAEPATFIANGIVVGDVAAMRHQYRSNRRSLDYMRDRMPAIYQRDYESALADLRTR